MNRKERRHRQNVPGRRKPLTKAAVPEALQRLIALYEDGRVHEALNLCRQILAVTPDDPNLLHLGGTIAAQLGDHAETVELLENALAIDPNHPDAYYNLGNALRALDRVDESITAYQKAIEGEPGLAEAHNNLGIVLANAGRLPEAVAAYRRAIEARPEHAGTHSNLAVVLFALGQLDEAEASCRRAISIAPETAAGYNGLANILKAQGRLPEAAATYGRAIEVDPSYAEAFSNLAILMQTEGELDGAIIASRRAIELMPTLIDAYMVLGQSLQLQGRHEDARIVYDLAQKVEPEGGSAFRNALLVPLVPDSREAIAAAREEVDRGLDALMADGIRIDDANSQASVTPFFLAAHGEDDRPLNEKLARLYRKACPALDWRAPQLDLPRPRRKGLPIRVGFASAHLDAGHAVGRLFGGLIKRLPRDRFKTLILRPQSGADPLDTAADQVVSLSEDLMTARRRVADLDLDVLIYPDLGTDPLTYFLAFARLAPVQCATVGHPVTSGIPSIDFFLTTADLDPDGAEAAYTERLERLPRLPFYADRRPVDDVSLPGREALGLPAGRTVYVCPQSLFRIHPDFDAILADILARDPDGLAILAGGADQQLAARLYRRLAAAIPGIDRQVSVLNALADKQIRGLLATADVVLDTPHFSEIDVVFDALALGTPVVTWPSGFARGRLAAALYRQMDMTDLIADDLAAYAELAVRLATDTTWRNSLRNRIREGANAVFEDAAAVEGLVAFLQRVTGDDDGALGGAPQP